MMMRYRLYRKTCRRCNHRRRLAILIPKNATKKIKNTISMPGYVIVLCLLTSCINMQNLSSFQFQFQCVIVYSWISPQSTISTVAVGAPLGVPKDSNFFKSSSPWSIFPKTVCFPSNQGVSWKQMKNCEPLVLGPALAIDKTGPL